MELTTLFTEHGQLLGSICGAVLAIATAVIGRKVVLVHTFGGKRQTSAADKEVTQINSDPEEKSWAEGGPALQITLAALLESDEPLSVLNFSWEPIASEVQPSLGMGKPEIRTGLSRSFHEQAEVALRLGKEGLHPSLADAELVVRTAEDNFRRLYGRVQTVRPQMTIAEHNHLFRAALFEIDDSPNSGAPQERYPRPSPARSYQEQLQYVIRAWRVLDAARDRYEAVRAEHLVVPAQRPGDLV
jgi:hypothetical protein